MQSVLVSLLPSFPPPTPLFLFTPYSLPSSLSLSVLKIIAPDTWESWFILALEVLGFPQPRHSIFLSNKDPGSSPREECQLCPHLQTLEDQYRGSSGYSTWAPSCLVILFWKRFLKVPSCQQSPEHLGESCYSVGLCILKAGRAPV